MGNWSADDWQRAVGWCDTAGEAEHLTLEQPTETAVRHRKDGAHRYRAWQGTVPAVEWTQYAGSSLPICVKQSGTAGVSRL